MVDSEEEIQVRALLLLTLKTQRSLPNFFGESMDPGQLIVVVGIVVIFAYLLGAMVFILDFVSTVFYIFSYIER